MGSSVPPSLASALNPSLGLPPGYPHPYASLYPSLFPRPPLLWSRSKWKKYQKTNNKNVQCHPLRENNKSNKAKFFLLNSCCCCAGVFTTTTTTTTAWLFTFLCWMFTLYHEYQVFVYVDLISDNYHQLLLLLLLLLLQLLISWEKIFNWFNWSSSRQREIIAQHANDEEIFK